MPPFAATPEPPYWAVVFTSRHSGAAVDDYEAVAAEMERLAATIPGYLGIESARDAAGLGITVSYWESEAAIEQWRRHPDHLQAQARGRSQWYDHFELRVARVERARSYGPS